MNMLRWLTRPFSQGQLSAIIAALSIGAAFGFSGNAYGQTLVSLSGQVTPAVSFAHAVSTVAAGQQISLTLVLPLRDESNLTAALQSLYNPSSPDFHHFLTSQQFIEQYCPTAEDYAALENFARQNGLRIMGTHDSRLLLDVVGPASAVEQAFHVKLLNYVGPDGKSFYASDGDPAVPDSVADIIQAVVGLDNLPCVHPNFVRRSFTGNPSSALPNAGTGPYGTMTPNDIRTAYNLNASQYNGAGQVLALMELDGYAASDITGYENAYGLPNATLQNVLIDGFGGQPSGTGGQSEVTLDIELDLAMAPSISKIMVYEASNSYQGLLDDYARIADDDAAMQISSSWGLPEEYGGSLLSAENAIFSKMAAQGQSIYVAAGDSGAYADGSDLSVQDPASQPYVCAVGGTTLNINGSQQYIGEATWGYGNEGGGGGESVIWSKPSYQSGLGLSPSMRDVPDVSLDSDPNTGYNIYLGGGWCPGFGGTSCAAPLWAAFTALINQQRAANGLGSPLGFADPALYNLAASPDFANDFHDIADNSTNLFYIAVPGYDDATGLGSFNGSNMLNDLSSATPPSASLQVAPTNLAATALGNTQMSLSWTAASGATGYNILRSLVHNGPYTKVGVSTSPSFTDSGLTSGKAYYYVATANGPNGVSANSAEARTAMVSSPSNLTATAISSTAITLSWTSSTGAIRYNILRGTAHGGPYSAIATSTSTNYTNPSLTVGTSYYYVVTATLNSGTSAQSNEATAMTPCAVPTTLVTSPISSTQINLTWTASTNAASYNILRGTAHGGPYASIGTSTISKYSDTNGLAAVTPFYYIVQAVNANSVPSANSAEATTTTLAAVPTNLAASPISGTEIDLTWTPSTGATSYNLLRSTVHNGPCVSIAVPVTNSYKNTGLSPSTNYYYVVESKTSKGSSANSAEATAKTLPPSPTGLTAGSISETQINLSWTACTGATGYVVSRGAATGGPYSQTGTTTSTLRTFSDTGLAANTAYFYVVQATTSAGLSPNSNEATTTTRTDPPTNPVASALSPTQIGVSWTAATGATSYAVLRGTAHNGPYSQVVTTTTTGYVDATLAAGTTYYYVVRSINPGGLSVNSTEASAATPPATPTGLIAKGVSAGGITLTWSAAAGATGYIVLESTVHGGPYSALGPATSASYIVGGLNATTQYYFVVEATTALATSQLSNEATTTTLGPGPLGLTATTQSSTSIALAWTSLYGASTYAVYRGTTSGGPYTKLYTTTVASYTDNAAAAAKTYYYVVTATVAGIATGYGNEASAMTLTATPTTLVAHTISATQINLLWAAGAGATGYIVLRSTSHLGPYSQQVGAPTGAGFNDTSASPGTQYYYVVEATNSGGSTPNSNEATAMTLASAPTNLSATAVGATEIDLAWNGSGGATGYAVLRSTKHGGPYTQISAPGAFTFADKSVSGTTTYYYVVKAVNTSGSSAISNEASAEPLLPAPTGLTATAAGPTLINLKWNAFSGATSYTVRQSSSSAGAYGSIETSGATTFAVANLTPGTPYYFVVTATTSTGYTAPSNVATATTHSQ